jgi:hypothetical protein
MKRMWDLRQSGMKSCGGGFVPTVVVISTPSTSLRAGSGRNMTQVIPSKAEDLVMLSGALVSLETMLCIGFLANACVEDAAVGRTGRSK